MEYIYLNVNTVPAFDSETLMPHTAYNIYRYHEGKLTTAAGWTLKDAIEFYALKHNCAKENIRLKRPFKPQHIAPYQIL